MAAEVKVSMADAASWLSSRTRPASTCCWSTPPPQVEKTSGTSPAAVWVVILDLKASFSSSVILIRTPGFSASNSLAQSR